MNDEFISHNSITLLTMYKLFKRFCDFSAALVLLLLLSPLLIPIVVLLRLSGEGYVFYYQRRVGYKNRLFDIWKFATMLKDSPNIGTGTITLRNDPRVTPMGGFLRKSKLNELPQIVNVLKGDMSLVGPRPLDEKGFNAYPEAVRAVIYNVTPGITGIGSVIFRDEEQLISSAKIPPREFYNQFIAPYKGELELWYQANQSFMTDVKIILLTVAVILMPESKLAYRFFPALPPRRF